MLNSWRASRGLSLWLFLCTLFSGVLLQSVSKTGFDKAPSRFFYFKDSPVILWLDALSHTVYRSENQGKEWQKINDIGGDEATFLYEHPFDVDRAYVLGKGKTHWKTTDKGKTWQQFSTLVEPAAGGSQLSFHAERPGYVLFTGFKCNLGSWTGVDCHDETYYTLNNFEELTLLRTHITSCIWSLSSQQFENAPVKEVMCVESPKKKGVTSILNPEELRLVQSEDFFHTEQVVDFGTGKEVKGVIAVSAINRFIVAVVKPSPAEEDMILYISQDGEKWHQAVFPEGATLHEKSFTIVESTGSSSLLIDVLGGGSDQFGSLYKSNSNGTFFVKSLEHTNRNLQGFIDFERVQGVEGIMIANIITNPTQIDSPDKDIRTRMSFDDGASWKEITSVKDIDGQDMKCSGDSCSLHLHSVTAPRNSGQVFSSKTAVGVMMGVGSFGANLLEYDECDTYLSTDSGLNWQKVREGAHKYEFGDMGTLLVIIDDEKETDHVWWSKDRGTNWQKLDLGLQIRARILTTDAESTTRNFLLIGSSVRSSDSNVQAIQLDFSDVSSRQCEFNEKDESKSDFEKWYARDITDGPDCLMGHEQMFYRRKADRDCYVGLEFQDPVTELKECPCTVADYECDYNFARDSNGKCARIGPDVIPNGLCKSGDDTYPSSSGYRLIPGNTCVLGKSSNALDEPVDRKCSDNTADVSRPSDSFAQPSDDNVSRYKISFTSEIEQFVYFKNSEAVLVRLTNGEVWRSADQGVKWTRVLEDGPIRSILLHEFDDQRAYAFTEKEFHVTEDRGANWRIVKAPLSPSTRASQVLDFHPQEKDWLLYIGEKSDPEPHSEAYVSRNHGRDWDSLQDMYVEKCIFGRDSKYEIEKETVFCSVYDKKQVGGDARLIRTTDWGRTSQAYFESVVEFFVVEDFMAVASSDRGELSLFVSVDGKTFAQAQFPPDHYINRNTFTVLQSTTHSILLNIFKSVTNGKAYGSLYKSNENGTFYELSLDNTNGDGFGFVDFEKLQSVDGAILANQVWNADELIGRDQTKKVRSMITWDDGVIWQPLQPPSGFDCRSKECTLNLHSRTDIHGPGAIFTSSGAPGLAMGVGNVGAALLDYTESDTFLTRDGGHNWVKIQDGEHFYEFGDQGSILVLVTDEKPTTDLLYSWDQGETWHYYEFSEEPIRVNTLTTDPLSSTLRFIIVGHDRGAEKSQVMITVDFSDAKLRECVMDKNNGEKSDFERWIPKDDDGDDACLLGKSTAYWRRKKDRACKVNKKFHEPEVNKENCECRDIDFVCDFGFWRNSDNECVARGRHPDRPATCKSGDTFRGRSGYKINSRSTCNGGINLEDQKEWQCGESGGISSSRTEFTDRVVDYIYFTDTDRVIVRTADGKIWRSDNDGYSWKEQFPDHKVISIYQNPHFNQRAYFITDGEIHFSTTDAASNFEEMRVPILPVLNLQGTIMNFHNDDPDYLIYVGEKNCENGFSKDCHSEAFYSRDNGRGWSSIGTYMRSCIWGREGGIKDAHRNSIFCEQYRDQSGSQMNQYGNPLQFVSSNDYFHDKKVVFDDIVGVTVFGKYMVVAASRNGGANLRLLVSLDGVTFATASFPASFEFSPEAFTIMESANSMWIHVSTNTHRGSEYGTIFTSNSNGTYFVSSLDNANRNEMGIVDFEKMQGIEGISIANIVSNPGQANKGDPKKLVTRKTADAGGHWTTLTPPSKDSRGQSYDCRDKDCALQLHCYSERQNSRDLFSLSSAVGLMVGVGNVGKSLTRYTDGDMFLTRDAGKTWTEIQKGAHLWEFADQGALLILVNNEEATNTLQYTTNEGLKWQSYEFTKKEDKVIIEDIITQPDGTSQKYVLFGLKNGKSVAYHIDFSALHPTKCKLDMDHPNDDDFELWSPEDTRGEKCLFGRETQYFRRIQDRDCYIGEKLVQPREVVRNCTCTEADYECDFNFVRDSNNKCVLVPGLSPLEPQCDGTRDFYYKPTGYRKIAASTCQGGNELEKGEEMWCPGASHSGGGWFGFIAAPILGAGLVFAALHYRKHGGFGGRIRLPDGTQNAGANILSSPIVTKIAAAVFVVPVAIAGILSRISFSDLFSNIRLPSFLSRDSNRYRPLDQDEHTGVLLEDYDGSEEHLIDEADEVDDADEF